MIIDVATYFKTIIDVVIILRVLLNAYFLRKVREEISSVKVDVYWDFMTNKCCNVMMHMDD